MLLQDDKGGYMKLSIIILNYKTRGLLRQCLKAIYQNPPDFSYEVIVIDNNSYDGSQEMTQCEFTSVKFLALDKNYGYAGGNNRGLRAASGEFLAILNPDILIRAEALTKLVKFMEENQNVGIVGPKLLNPDGTLQYSCFHFPKLQTPIYRRTILGYLPFAKAEARRYLMADWAHNTPRDVDWLLGGALVIRRQAYEAVGELDERFFLYFDEVDYARRMHQAGRRVVYYPQAEMVHFHQRESAGSLWSLFTNKVTRIHVYSGIKYFWKWSSARKRVERNPASSPGN